MNETLGKATLEVGVVETLSPADISARLRELADRLEAAELRRDSQGIPARELWDRVPGFSGSDIRERVGEEKHCGVESSDDVERELRALYLRERGFGESLVQRGLFEGYAVDGVDFFRKLCAHCVCLLHRLKGRL